MRIIEPLENLIPRKEEEKEISQRDMVDTE